MLPAWVPSRTIRLTGSRESESIAVTRADGVAFQPEGFCTLDANGFYQIPAADDGEHCP